MEIKETTEIEISQGDFHLDVTKGSSFVSVNYGDGFDPLFSIDIDELGDLIECLLAAKERGGINE